VNTIQIHGLSGPDFKKFLEWLIIHKRGPRDDINKSKAKKI